MMQGVKFLNCSIVSLRCPLQEGALKVGPAITQVRYGSQLRKRFKLKSSRTLAKIELPITLFNPNFKEDPISASVGFEDMAEVRNRDFSDDLASITARGFHRFQKPYEPTPDAADKFLSLVKSINPSLSELPVEKLKKVPLSDPEFKFDILAKAAKEFQHAVPNSMLTAIRTIGAASKFYETPISTNTPFDTLVRMGDELPPNLYIQKEPIRFTEDTNHIFGGISAFPKDSNVITGLRAKEKYTGYKAKKSWP